MSTSKYGRHGHAAARTPAYRVWMGMRARCHIPTNTGWRDYGGRGIRVCERWDSFQAFLADMGEPPKGMTLDRKDNDGNYEPNNCRWATPKEQARNRRKAVPWQRRPVSYIEVGGVRRSLREVEIELGLSVGAIWHRLKLGWSPELAYTTPRKA